MRSAGYDTNSNVPGLPPLPRQVRLCSSGCSAATIYQSGHMPVLQSAGWHTGHVSLSLPFFMCVELMVKSESISCAQDDLLAALTGDRASDLDRKLAATPIIQKLLLADGAT